MKLKTFATLLLMILLYSNISWAAEKKGNKQADTSSFAFKSCGKGPKALAQDLERLSSDLSAWVKNQKSEKLTTAEFGKTRKGQFLKLYAPHLLPKKFPFLSVYKICWVSYIDFQKALEASNLKTADKELENWKTCVAVSFDPFPVEAKELLQCWTRAQIK